MSTEQQRQPSVRSTAYMPSRSMWRTAIGLAVVLVLAVTGMGFLIGPGTADAAPAVQVTGVYDIDQSVTEVAARDNFFEPETVTITVGSIVRWTNEGDNLHTTTSTQGHWNWTLVPGASYGIRFLSAGTYPYECLFHQQQGMTGTVVVVPSDGPTATPSIQPTPPVGPTAEPGASAIVYDYFADEAARDQTDLFLIQPDGTGKQRLTNTTDLSEVQPSWAPDRRRIAHAASAVVTGTQNRNWALWSLDTDTGQQTQITSGPEQYEPDWKPDGSLIAFTNIQRAGGRVNSSQIAVIRPDGGGFQPLIQLNSTAYAVGSPNWSPTGMEIAFTLNSTISGGDIYVMDASGRNARRLFAHPGWNDAEPVWSPDGRYLAFSSGPYRGDSTLHDIWIYDSQTRVFGTVAQHPTWDLRRPTWSPDGSRIVFTAKFETSPARWALYLVPATGGTVSGPLTGGVEPDWASGSLEPVPTPMASPSPTPPTLPTPMPFPTIPTPEPTEPGPTATNPPPPTFPPPDNTATPTATDTPSEPTEEPTPERTTAPDEFMIYLPIVLRGVSLR